LPTNLTILDIGAGPATVAFGLALLIESSVSFGTQTSPNICYFSLDKQKMFQFRGLQFWRKYIESKQSPPNAYFRFVTKDILKPDLEIEKLPKQFFNFIVISHCFFSDSDSQVYAKHNYIRIIQNCLQPGGYVLLIVQNKKLFRIYNESPSDDIEQEKEIVNKFLGELGLQLVWYKCLSSTESRQPLGGKRFRQYATDRLAAQQYISKVAQEYLGIPYDYSYVLDDYIILASYN
jgi:SAM-dependent methyltransferase